MSVRDTVIVSDMHLTEVQPENRRRPFWMAYKRRAFFPDGDFGRLLEQWQDSATGPLELVLNGDIFDFDSVVATPANPPHKISWLGRLRGLASEEWMSLYKLDRIIEHHPDWFRHLAAFVARGGRVVFVIGNHDIELSWPVLQERLRQVLGLATTAAGDDGAERRATDSAPAAVEASGAQASGELVFCQWFYLSGGDTYISHGHQYDANCSVPTPIDPLISVGGRARVRVPFGDLAGRYILNGMGYFNPHATDNFIMGAADYLRFFLRYVARTQPLLLWSWFWGSMVTLIVSLRDHWRPAMRDPLTVDAKVRAIADNSGVAPAAVRQLNAVSVASACHNPFRLLRELWLDRGLLLFAVFYAAWQIILVVNLAWPISPLWVLLPLGFLLPPYIAYAASVRPTVFKRPLLDEDRAGLISQITGAQRVVFGHTHVPEHSHIGPVEYLNGGSWSPIFKTPECRERIGAQTFVRLKPASEDADESARVATLCQWPFGGDAPAPFAARSSRSSQVEESAQAGDLDLSCDESGDDLDPCDAVAPVVSSASQVSDEPPISHASAELPPG